MNPDASLPPDAREARLTALLHGELPAAEAEALRAEIAADAALAALFRRLSLADSLARETVRSPEPKELSKPEPLQLAPERRAALLAKFSTPPANVVRVPAFARKAWADRHELLALAAMLVAVVTAAGMFMPALAKAKSKAQRVSAAHTARMAELEGRMGREEAVNVPVHFEDRERVQPVQPPTDGLATAGDVPADLRLAVPPPPAAVPLAPVLARRYGMVPAGAAPAPRPLADNSSSAGDSLEVLSKQRTDSDGDPKSINEQVLERNAVVLPAGKSLAANDGHGAATTEFFGSVDQPTRGENTVGETALAGGFHGAAGNGRGLQTWEFRTSAGIGGTAGGGFAGGAGVAVAGAPINSAAPAPVPAPQEGFAAATADTVAFAVEVKGPTVLSSELRSQVASDKKTELADQAAVLPANGRDVLARSLERGRGVDGGTRAGLVGAPRGYLDDATQSGKAESAVGLGFDAAKDGGSPNAIRVQERLAEADQGRFALFQQNGLAIPRVTAQEPPPTEEAQSQAEAKERSQPLATLGVPAQVVEAADAPTDVTRFVRTKAKADTAANGFVQLDRLAEGEELRQQVTLAKPVLNYSGLVTNAAPPALGDAPVLGRLFKGGEVQGQLAENNAAVAGSTLLAKRLEYPAQFPQAPGQGHSSEQRDLETLKRLQGILMTKVSQEEVDGAIAKKSPVEIIDFASANPAEKPGLLAKLRSSVSGEQTRTARLKVERDTPDIQLLGYAAGNQTYDPYFLQTEFEQIKSRQVLTKAAEKLNLPPTEDTYRQLERQLSVSQYRDTAIVEIQAKDADPAKAAQIANAVSEAYEEFRSSNRTERNQRGLEVLKLKLDELTKQIAAKEALLTPTEHKQNSTVREPDAPLPKLAPGAPEPQAEVATADNAFSTFSLNVSDVSFKLSAAALEQGQMPEPATVRTEEFINAFEYRDPEPVGGAPVAFAWERARYPFAHDRDLVRFSVKTAASGRQPGRPLNLVLLLDNSGSMERADRVRIRQECLRVLAGQLQPQDRVSVVAFARTSRLWVDGLDGAQAAELPGRVGELTPDGGTNLEEALRSAYQTAARHFAANGVNRVVLLTDGAANLGDVEPDSLRRQVEVNRKQGIALDCFGIGWEGLNDELLESLSRNGDGRYGFVNTPEAAQSEFAGQLVGALQIAASDVKVQVEWNPRRVTAYRQLGYAKHQLKKEQFRDNTVDAAEIGAAEAGNALYTVQVNPAGEGPLGTVRVRFRVPGTDDYREQEWPLLYDGTARPLDQAGPALRLAASASAFSEWLVSSPWAAEVTPDRLLALQNGITDTYAADPRPKQFLQMLQQAKRVSGK